MPFSDPRFDGILLTLAQTASLAQAEFNILDIGAGAGKTAKLLRPLADRIDGVEPWIDYWQRFDLRSLYDRLYVQSAQELTLDEIDGHWFVVLGDVLEHLAVGEAVSLLAMLKRCHCLAYVQVPYEYAQGPLEGNPYEIHLQADLTPALMRARYPMLAEIYSDARLGAWVLWP